MWRDIFKVVSDLIFASPKAWKEIDKKNYTQNLFLNRFLHPIFGVIALASFVGGVWFTKGGNVESALKQTIVSVVAVYGGYFIATYALNELAPRFELKKSIFRFQKFVGYSSIVLYLLYIVIPLLSDFIILWLIALYTIHVVYNGAMYFVKVNEGKLVNFTLIAAALIILSPAAIHFLFSITIK